MSGECDNDHDLEFLNSLTEAMRGSIITKMAYDRHKIKYSIYEGNNRFYGTPIPEGYEAVYLDDGFCPPSLQVRKINER